MEMKNSKNRGSYSEQIVSKKISDRLGKYLHKPPVVFVRVKEDQNLETITAAVRTDEGCVLVAKNQDVDIDTSINEVVKKPEKQLKKKIREKKRKRRKINSLEVCRPRHVSLKNYRFPYQWGYEPYFVCSTK